MDGRCSVVVVVVVVALLQHDEMTTLWRRRDCVVGRGWMGRCVYAVVGSAFVTLIYLRWPHRPFCLPSLPPPRYRDPTRTSPSKSEFTLAHHPAAEDRPTVTREVVRPLPN